MALAKEGYKSAIRGTAKIKVGINEDGNIAQEDDYVEGTKTINFTTANAENSLTDNKELCDIFVGFVGGEYSTLGSAFSVTWTA